MNTTEIEECLNVDCIFNRETHCVQKKIRLDQTHCISGLDKTDADPDDFDYAETLYNNTKGMDFVVSDKTNPKSPLVDKAKTRGRD